MREEKLLLPPPQPHTIPYIKKCGVLYLDCDFFWIQVKRHEVFHACILFMAVCTPHCTQNMFKL